MTYVVPNDLNPPVATYAVCWYDDKDWLALIEGFMTSLVDTDAWDRDTGDVEAAAEAAALLLPSSLAVSDRGIDMGCLNIVTGAQYFSHSVLNTGAGGGTFLVQTIPAGAVLDLDFFQIVNLGGTASFQLYTLIDGQVVTLGVLATGTGFVRGPISGRLAAGQSLYIVVTTAAGVDWSYQILGWLYG